MAPSQATLLHRQRLPEAKRLVWPPDADQDIHFLDQAELDALLAATVNPHGRRKPTTGGRSRRVKHPVTAEPSRMIREGALEKSTPLACQRQAGVL